MHSAGERIKNLVEDLLSYSRVGHEHLTFTEFNLNDSLNAALENLKVLISEQKAQITADLLPNIKGNPIQLMRLLQNLIANAIKYQPPANSPKIHIQLTELPDYWQIAIEDNGLGIAENQLNEIFMPFKRLHSWSKIKGSGLGLSICKKIVELHKGTLTVSSTPGKGSVFFINLPKN